MLPRGGRKVGAGRPQRRGFYEVQTRAYPRNVISLNARKVNASTKLRRLRA